MSDAKVIGLRKIRAAIDSNAKWLRDALAAALYQEGLAIDAMSVKQVPVEHGTLKTSHYVAPPSNPKRPEVEIGYGTDYAVYVHERLDLRHKSPTKAKYLQDPFEARKQGFTTRLARRTRRNWVRKVGLGGVHATAPTKPIVQGEDK